MTCLQRFFTLGVCSQGLTYKFHKSLTFTSMQAAKDLGVAVKGVSFHVGSGATDPEAFREAIHLARGAFDAGAGAVLIYLLQWTR